MAPRREEHVRLFFALWPDAAIRSQLEHISTQLAPKAGRAVKLENYHTTLLFLGSVPADCLAALLEAADAIQAESFTLTIDRTGWWRRSGIFWLAPGYVPPALLQLVASLREAAARLGLPLEARDYQPHITLRRKARNAHVLPRFTPFAWPAREFCLVQSETRAGGPVYRVLKCRPLQRAASLAR